MTLRLTAVAAIVLGAFAVDQITKAWALTYLGDGYEIALGLEVTFRLVFNPGVAFGIGADVGAPLVVGIIVLTFGLLALTAVRAIQRRSAPPTALLALAVGGAVGNIWDRVTRATAGPLTGKVVDFIAVDWFAIFNVADIFTTLGLAGFALLLIFKRHPETETDPTQPRVARSTRPS